MAGYLIIERNLHVENTSIKNAIENIGVKKTIIDWKEQMLETQIIHSQLAGSEFMKTVTKGTSQR